MRIVVRCVNEMFRPMVIVTVPTTVRGEKCLLRGSLEHTCQRMGCLTDDSAIQFALMRCIFAKYARCMTVGSRMFYVFVLELVSGLAGDITNR